MTVRTLTQSNVPTAERLAAILQQLSRIVVGKSEPLNQEFAERFTAHFADLAAKYPEATLTRAWDYWASRLQPPSALS